MSAQSYRRHAAECLQISLAVADPEARALLKRMAIAWTDLADQAENSLQTLKSFPQQQQELRPPMGLDFDRLTPDEQRRVLDGPVANSCRYFGLSGRYSAFNRAYSSFRARRARVMCSASRGTAYVGNVPVGLSQCPRPRLSLAHQQRRPRVVPVRHGAHCETGLEVSRQDCACCLERQ